MKKGLHFLFTTAMAALLMSAISCSGGSGGGGGDSGGDSSLPLPDTVLKITAEPTTVKPGNDVVVAVSVENVENLYGAAFDVVYDPDKLEFISASGGAFLKTGGAGTNFAAALENETPGRIVSGVSRKLTDTGVDGDGVLATLTFRARFGASGTTEIRLGAASLRDTAYLVLSTQLSDGVEVTISAP